MTGPTLPTLLLGKALEGELDRISFRYAEISQSRRCLVRAAWALNRSGIIRLIGVAAPELVLSLNHEVNDLLESLKIYRTNGTLPDNIANTYLNTQEKLMLAGYKRLVSADKAVINTRFSRPDGRSGSDAGMIDIFHPEKLSKIIHQTIQICAQNTRIKQLISLSTMRKIHKKCHNLYINNGVQDTRGFHCDGRSLKFKSFLFLTDVKELKDGPYCYVKGTHRNGSAWDRTCKFNSINNIDRCEFTQLGKNHALAMLANAGDMVISSQSGAHRGHPQGPDGQRRALVTMYSPKKH